MADIAKREISVVADIEEMRAIFSDMIQVSSNADNVVINFLQTIPGWEPKDKLEMQLVSRIVMTWPHFLRTLNTLNAVKERDKDKALDRLKSLVSPEIVV
jgi:hypothetical protein